MVNDVTIYSVSLTEKSPTVATKKQHCNFILLENGCAFGRKKDCKLMYNHGAAPGRDLISEPSVATTEAVATSSRMGNIPQHQG